VTTDTQPSQIPVADLDEDPIVLGLRQLYDSVLDEPVPKEFMSFLSQIDDNASLTTTELSPEQADRTHSTGSGGDQ
jgi:Na+-transporting NADH:ubiquinone oxidoreductase subunit NqrA